MPPWLMVVPLEQKYKTQKILTQIEVKNSRNTYCGQENEQLKSVNLF